MAEIAVPDRHRGWLVLLIIALGALPILYSLGDHPLYGRSDARYAEVSREMAVSGNWLVPQKRGEPHLTKPPLVYWAEALLMRLTGPSELAARFPSALAGIATLALLGWYARRVHGSAVAGCAVALLSVMPLQVVISRLPLTDAPLCFFWFLALVSGILAVSEPQHRRWPLLLWLATALSLLCKGPQALLPLAILLAWLLISGRRGEIRRLRIPLGLPLAAVPILLWVALVLRSYPDAANLWISQIRGASTDNDVHPEPFWYFIPVFLGGLFPATLLMRWPWFHYPWRSGWQALRRTDNELTVWVLALALPLLFFSIRSGKLATYMMPLCAPAALLTAICLRRWITGAYAQQPYRGLSPAQLHLVVASVLLIPGILVVAAVLLPARLTAAGGDLRIIAPRLLFAAPIVLLVFAASAWGCIAWGRRQSPPARSLPRALAAIWMSLLLLTLAGDVAEQRLLPLTSVRDICRQAAITAKQEGGRLVLLGSDDLAFSFYLQTPIDQSHASEIRAARAERLCVIARTSTLDAARKADPDFLARYDQTPLLNQIPADKRFRILWPAKDWQPQPATMPATLPMLAAEHREDSAR